MKVKIGRYAVLLHAIAERSNGCRLKAVKTDDPLSVLILKGTVSALYSATSLSGSMAILLAGSRCVFAERAGH